MATRPPSAEVGDVSKALEQAEKENAELKDKVFLQGQDIERLHTDVKRLSARIDALPVPPVSTDPDDPNDPTDPIPDTPPPPPPSNPLPPGGSAIPTFHSVGLYLTPPSDPGDDGIKVEYKKSTSGVWILGHPLWYDIRNKEARGSIVYLDPNTDYDVRFSMPGEPPYASLTFKTWNEVFPEKSVTRWANGAVTDMKVITVGGSATDGYVVYTSPVGGRTVLKQPNISRAYPIRIATSYVIIRGVTVEGGQNCITIDPGMHHIVIEDCDLSKFGQPEGVTSVEGWALSRDRTSGIRLGTDSTPNTAASNIVIQRNKIHDPALGSNSWDDGHPEGPQGITFHGSGGQHVIRYNEIYSSDVSKWFNDGISGTNNFSTLGFPSSDSDIYKNIVKNCWDDAIEAEGGVRNVRIWSNYTDRVFCPIGSAVVHIGPCYIFRNVFNRQKRSFAATPDGDDRGRAIKAYTEGSWGNGMRYVYHNTLLQWPGSSEGATRGLGAGEGISGPMSYTKTRNNIFHTWTLKSAAIRDSLSVDPGNVRENNFNYDLRNGVLSNVPPGSEANVGNTSQVPTYKSGHGPTVGQAGLYQLQPGTPGHDQGEVIPNFNDGFLGAAPDVGAHEEGSPAMQFGLTATGY